MALTYKMADGSYFRSNINLNMVWKAIILNTKPRRLCEPNKVVQNRQNLNSPILGIVPYTSGPEVMSWNWCQWKVITKPHGIGKFLHQAEWVHMGAYNSFFFKMKIDPKKVCS